MDGKLIFLALLAMLVIGSINKCTDNKERELTAVEQIASQAKIANAKAADEESCSKFMKSPQALVLIVQALVARNFIDTMSTEDMYRIPVDQLRQGVKDYQSQWLKYDSVDATGFVDCLTIKSLGLLQSIEKYEH